MVKKIIRSNPGIKIADRIFIRSWLTIRNLFRPLKKNVFKQLPVDGRILITKTCCMGDAILSLYAIKESKIQNPGLVIDILVQPSKRNVPL